MSAALERIRLLTPSLTGEERLEALRFLLQSLPRGVGPVIHLGESDQAAQFLAWCGGKCCAVPSDVDGMTVVNVRIDRSGVAFTATMTRPETDEERTARESSR
jgi:hypothetical protein